jgi:hypothetical protein
MSERTEALAANLNSLDAQVREVERLLFEAQVAELAERGITVGADVAVRPYIGRAYDSATVRQIIRGNRRNVFIEVSHRLKSGEVSDATHRYSPRVVFTQAELAQARADG